MWSCIIIVNIKCRLLALLPSSRSHLVADLICCGRRIAARRPEPGLSGGGWGGGLSDSHLQHLLPPLPLQPVQHHDGGEHRRRPDLEHAQKPLRAARTEDLRRRAWLRHPGERTMWLWRLKLWLSWFLFHDLYEWVRHTQEVITGDLKDKHWVLLLLSSCSEELET